MEQSAQAFLELLNKKLNRLEQQLKRTKNRKDAIKAKHDKYDNKTEHWTYHAGWDLGYHEGKETTLEDEIDELQEIITFINNELPKGE